MLFSFEPLFVIYNIHFDLRDAVYGIAGVYGWLGGGGG